MHYEDASKLFDCKHLQAIQAILRQFPFNLRGL